MAAAKLIGTVTLKFDRRQLTVGDGTDIRSALSAVALSGDVLWLACDEGCRLEQLSRSSSSSFSGHTVFPLDDLLSLPAPATEEADVEGLYVDDGWLWLVGSHSVKRKKPKDDDSVRGIAKQLAKTGRDGNRHLLARVPIAGTALRRVDGERRAASIAATATTSALLDAITAAGNSGEADRHLAPFVPLPGKDNGFDIEGLAVVGTRAFVGLRGPVLREWSCILEIPLEIGRKRLRLQPGGDGVSYRKHFVRLNGLGVRDLVVLDDDLLVLAGPTMAHDGPCEIWRWRGGARKQGPASPPVLTRLAVLPQGEGADRAEGFTILEHGAVHTSALVVFDTPVPQRLHGVSSVTADVYRLF